VKIINLGPANPLRGGIANFNESLSLEFLKMGHDTHVVSYSLQYPNIFFPGKTQFTDSPAPKGLVIKAILNSVNPFNWIWTGKKIKKENPDVVIIHYWMSFFGPALGTVCRIIKKNKKTKIIALCHNIIPHEKKPYDKLFTSYFIKKCDGYIAMSKAVLNDLNEFTNSTNKVFSPHPAYDLFGTKTDKALAREKLQIGADTKLILFFGMVRNYKGLDLLLESLASPLLKQENVTLLVAGEFYDSIEEYKQQIEKLGIADKVILRDEFIATDDVKYFFSASDIVAQTYKTATQSGVTQIAYHFDVPMLVTNVGGLAEIVPHNEVGYICEKQPDDIARSLNDFFENNRFNEFSENVKNRKHMFSWGNFANDALGLV